MQAASAASFSGLTARGLVLVKFWATWCHPCHQLTPVVDALAASVPGIKVVTVNVDEERDLTKQRGVRAIPSLQLYRDGVLVGQRVGLANAAQLRSQFGL